MKIQSTSIKPARRRGLKAELVKNRSLYIMAIPVVL